MQARFGPKPFPHYKEVLSLWYNGTYPPASLYTLLYTSTKSSNIWYISRFKHFSLACTHTRTHTHFGLYNVNTFFSYLLFYFTPSSLNLNLSSILELFCLLLLSSEVKSLDQFTYDHVKVCRVSCYWFFRKFIYIFSLSGLGFPTEIYACMWKQREIWNYYEIRGEEQ